MEESFWSFEGAAWNLFGIWGLEFGIFVLQRRTKLLPYEKDSLKYREMGEDGQDPEDGLHALEEASD